MIHNFEKSLIREKQQALKADKYYLETLHVESIKRFNSNSNADMEMQRNDVDVNINISGKSYLVSEKFRDKDFGDFYIEVYSKFPNTYGWIHTGKPNAIVYFTPLRVFWIQHTSLKDFCLNILFPQIPINWFNQVIKSDRTIISRFIKLSNYSFKLNIIQAQNQLDDGSKWDTLGISLPFDVLTHFGVVFKELKSWNK